MANHLYSYASGHSSSIPTYSSVYTTTSETNAYDTSLLPSRYDWSSSSSLHSARGADGGASGRDGGMSLYSQIGWGEREILGAGYGMESMFAAGVKRQAEALYHQSAIGIHNSMGQSEALFSTNSLVKRPRFETASHLPVYPQHPGENDCTHYMLTRTCKFGENCKFDHPIWVPEGGIPDWKEVPLAPLTESLPERPGEPDCPYFIKTQKCKFGYKCKFNHPKDQIQTETADASILPERPSEPLCTYYAKTGKCKFGANCIFNHPKDLHIPAIGQGQKNSTANDGTENGDPFSMRISVHSTPALLHNTKGLPIRPGEQDCPFYLKTGSCKYGAACRYNHPERTAINLPLVGSVGHTMYQNLGSMNSSASLIPSIDPSLTLATIGLSSFVYPQRPGEPPCDFYMKTGHCKFAERCKFHHPVDGTAPSTVAKQAPKETVKLTLAGLPRREGATRCSFYMKTGHCMYAAKCRYDHPPPGEVAAMAANQGTVNADGTATAEEKNTTTEVDVEQT